MNKELLGISRLLWEYTAHLCQLSYHLRTSASGEVTANFAQNLYRVGRESIDLITPLHDIFVAEKRKDYVVADRLDDYVGLFAYENIDWDRINRESDFFQPSQNDLENVGVFLESVRPIIEREIGSCFTIVNVRCWRSGDNAEYGMYNWHRDGLPNCFNKILIYPLAPNHCNGSVELETRAGENLILDEETPVWLLINPNILKHRGVAGTKPGRLLIDILLAPALETSTHCHDRGMNSFYPWFPPSDILAPSRAAAALTGSYTPVADCRAAAEAMGDRLARMAARIDDLREQLRARPPA